MESINGEQFINSVFPDLHYSKEVMLTASKSDDPIEKIKKYFFRVESINERLINDKSKIHIVKEFFYDRYLTQELPNRYLEIQKKIEKKYSFTDEEKKSFLERVRNTQKESFDKWFDYLVTANYPTWFKYYILRGVLKSGVYDKSVNKITRRTKSTVEPFPDFNKDVILNIYNYIIENYGIDERLFDALKSLNFQKLYVYYMERLYDKNTDGMWVKFNQDSNPSELISSIQGKNTGWCTTLMDFATSHLNKGDFYIYFTKDRNEEYSIPRIAIRLVGDKKIEEIRGIGEHQNIERDMFDIILEKIKEFENNDEFTRVIKNYRLLNSIESKTEKEEELTIEELCCLYEIGDTLDGFGFSKEKRIEVLRSKRNIVKDLNRIFREVDCSDKSLNLSYLTNVEGIIFPDSFEELDLSGLKSLDHLVLSDKIKGNITLGGIEELHDYRFPSEINGTLDFEKLKEMSNVVFPKVVKNLYFKELIAFKNVVFPETVKEMLSFSKLEELNGFIFPHCHTICLRNVNSLRNVVFQEEIEGSIYISSLKEVENVIFPKVVKEQLDLSGLRTIKGIDLPSDYVKVLDIKQVSDFGNLTLPKEVGRLFLLKANITELFNVLNSHDVNELFADKYYKKEEILRLLEEHNAKKLSLKE